jgi:Cu-Zn family superoxide dismutase
MAVAVFQTSDIHGSVVFRQIKNGVSVNIEFSKLPTGRHGFHIHRGGDLRGDGCIGACDHWSLTNTHHGGAPHSDGERHTGDLGNIEGPACTHKYVLKGVKLDDIYGRSIIIHADEDDLGRGSWPDSHTTGHSGARMGCAIIGRIVCDQRRTTRKKRT